MSEGVSFRENQTCTKLWLPFCVAFAPLFPKGNVPFSSTRNPPASQGRPTISTESPEHESTVCPPPPGTRGQNVTKNGGPRISACLILAESYGGLSAGAFGPRPP